MILLCVPDTIIVYDRVFNIREVLSDGGAYFIEYFISRQAILKKVFPNSGKS